MPDRNLTAAQVTLDQLQNIAGAAYSQNAPVLIAEASLDVALAQAKTDRIRLLWDLLGETPEGETLMPDHARRVSDELVRLLEEITEPPEVVS